jgi:hypothetical protein
MCTLGRSLATMLSALVLEICDKKWQLYEMQYVR